MVQRNLILNKVIQIRQSIARIQTRALLSSDEFFQDADAQDIVKLNFQNAIQGCLDLADHIIADEEWGIPGSFGEAMDKLAEHGVISPAEAETYKKMGRFRNLLVHGYARVDHRELYKIMKTGLRDIEKYVESIIDYFKI